MRFWAAPQARGPAAQHWKQPVGGVNHLHPRGVLLERLAGPSVRHCLLEWLGSYTGMPAVWGLAVPLVTGLVGPWVEQCWAAEQDAAVRGGLQQCSQMSDLLRVNHSLPYEWRPLWPSVRGSPRVGSVPVGGPAAGKNVAGGWKESSL